MKLHFQKVKFSRLTLLGARDPNWGTFPCFRLFVKFNLVTVCLNSMHSKQKLLNWPSGVSFVSTEELLEYYYVGGESIRSDLGIFDSLDAYNMSRFHNETASTFDIVYCQFGPNDCRELWVPVMTYFGQGVFIRD